jgi:uncharacterized heparinase superfamily protein
MTPEEMKLFLRTARHLEPAQIASRVRHLLRRSWWRITARRPPRPASGAEMREFPLLAGLKDVGLPGPWQSDVCLAAERAARAAALEFRFLSREVAFGTVIRWNDPGLSQLWRYHLHYFDCVRDLLVWSALGNGGAAYDAFRRIATSWLEQNNRLRGDGWHPYTISLRVVNWLHAAAGFAASLDGDSAFDYRLQASLRGHMQVLRSCLETDVRGNHLLANLRALILFGAACDDAAAKADMARGLGMLEREIAEQVLADGGHFERSPGYHALVLQHCLEIAIGLRSNGSAVPRWLDEALERMLGYLAAILPDTGHLPLLKDTTWDGIPASDLFAAGALHLDQPRFRRSVRFGLYPLLLFGAEGWETYRKWPLSAGSEGPVALANTGHYVLCENGLRDHLIFDAGKPCPDYLPAHAHADLLSYELTVAGERVIVDSGVYEYSAGKWRDYFRSTRAHNTVEVARSNQSEVWSSFRVARRASPGPVLWADHGDYTILQGSHDGYRRLPVPVTHRRTIVWRRGEFWLILDELLGAGLADAASHIHLHPRLSLVCDGGGWRIQGTSCGLWLLGFGMQRYSIEQGWYSETFGDLQPNALLTVETKATLPFCWGYVIFRNEAGTVKFTAAAEPCVVIEQRGHTASVWLKEGLPRVEG